MRFSDVIEIREYSLTLCKCYGVIHKFIAVCPRSSDPFYIASYYIKRVTTSWTYSTMMLNARAVLGGVQLSRATVLRSTRYAGQSGHGSAWQSDSQTGIKELVAKKLKFPS